LLLQHKGCSTSFAKIAIGFIANVEVNLLELDRVDFKPLSGDLPTGNIFIQNVQCPKQVKSGVPAQFCPVSFAKLQQDALQS